MTLSALYHLPLLLLAGCRTPAPPYVDLPDPYVSRGVRVEITSLLRSATRIRGVVGTATNTTRDDFEYVSISFAAFDEKGARLGETTVRRDSMRAGERWAFKANFSSAKAKHLRSVHPAGVVTVVAKR